jgi:S-(hydroxymethyl)glutathione dehydrogenase/alcohol dehydrogenase
MTIEEVDLDPRLEPHELRLRTAVAGLCHSDLHYINGIWTEPLPIILGHEASAIVEEVGSAVTEFEPGDHVAVFCAPGCGVCPYCAKGRYVLCDNPPFWRPEGSEPRRFQGDAAINDLYGIGSFGEEMIADQASLVKIRKDVSLEIASLVSCSVITGFGAAAFTAGVRVGDTVAVVGAGGVGLNAVQGASFAGASRVIAVDRQAENLEVALEVGATDTVDASAVDSVEAVRDLAGGGVDHAFEAVGLVATAEQALSMTKKGGTATVIGMLPLESKITVPFEELIWERRLQSSVMGSSDAKRHMPMLIDLYLQGRLKLDPLMAEQITLDEINTGFEKLEGGRRARSLIVY